jgi:hypothetical protein
MLTETLITRKLNSATCSFLVNNIRKVQDIIYGTECEKIVSDYADLFELKYYDEIKTCQTTTP